MQKFRNHHSGVKILSLIKLMIYQFRGIFMVFTTVINAGLSVNRTSALVPYGDLALAVTRIVSLKNPIGIRKVSHLVWILNRLVIHLTSDVSTFDLFCQPFWSFFTFFFLKWETWQSVLLGCLSIVFIGYYVISPSLLTSFSMVTLLLVWVDFGLNWIKKKGTTTESLSRDERLRVIYSDYVYVITFIDSLKVKFPVDFRSKNVETIEKFRIQSQSIATKTNMFILEEQHLCWFLLLILERIYQMFY